MAIHSSYIYFNDNERSSYTAAEVYIGGVPTSDLEAMPAKFTECLKKVVKDGFDMERMATVLKRERLKVGICMRGRSLARIADDLGFSILTVSKPLLVMTSLWGSLMVGDFDSNFRSVLTSLFQTSCTDRPMVASCHNWPKSLSTSVNFRDGNQISGPNYSLSEFEPVFAVPLLILLTQNRTFIDNAPVTVLGRPSATLPDTLEKEEKARIAEQKKRLGPDGLARLVKELEDAKKEHEQPIPKEMLTSFPVPPISSISWIPVESAWNDPAKALSGPAAKKFAGEPSEVQKHVNKDAVELPFFVEFDHVKVGGLTQHRQRLE